MYDIRISNVGQFIRNTVLTIGTEILLITLS